MPTQPWLQRSRARRELRARYRVEARAGDSRAEVENSVAHAAPALRESKRQDLSAPHCLLARAFAQQQRPCQRRRHWLFVKAATARPLLVQASTSSTPRGTARGSIAQRAIVGAHVASCAASPSELRLHRHGRGGACLRAIALHRCNGALSRAPHDCRFPHGHLTAARTKERFFASQVTARGPIVAPWNTPTVPILQQPDPRKSRKCSEFLDSGQWAIQDSNLGPLPYQEYLLSPPVPPTHT